MVRLITLSLCLLLFSSVQAQEKWSLEKCINYALENNLQIKQTQLNEEVSKNQLTQAYADFLPTVNGSLNYGVNFGRSLDPTTYTFVNQRIQTSSLGASAGLTLFSGLNKIYTLKQSKYELESNRYATQDIANIVSLNITSSFLQILLNIEAQKTAEEHLKLSLEQVEQTRKLVDAGVLPEGNLLDVLATQATDSFTYTIAKNGVELSKLSLAIMLQLEDPATFDVEIPEINIEPPTVLKNNTAENVYVTALKNQPSIQSANYAVMGAEKSLSAVRGLYYPNIQFFYDLRTNHSSIARNIVKDIDSTVFLGNVTVDGIDYPITAPYRYPVYEKADFLGQYGDNLNHTVGFSLSVPIFNGLKTRTAVKNMELQVVKSKYALKAVEDKLKSDVYVAYADAKAAYQRFLAAKNSMSALERSLDYVTKKFDLGAATTLEYSTASNNLLGVQSEMLQSKYDYIFKLKVLDYYLGNRITLN